MEPSKWREQVLFSDRVKKRRGKKTSFMEPDDDGLFERAHSSVSVQQERRDEANKEAALMETAHRGKGFMKTKPFDKDEDENTLTQLCCRHHHHHHHHQLCDGVSEMLNVFFLLGFHSLGSSLRLYCRGHTDMTYLSSRDVKFIRAPMFSGEIAH